MKVTVRERDGLRVRELNDVMEFDHVIMVHRDGTVSEPRGMYAPDLFAINGPDGSHTANTDPELMRQAESAGWKLETGWTGQQSYSGPCMHSSEVMDGGIARHVLQTPGYWVTLVVYEEDDSDPSCWALAHRPLPEHDWQRSQFTGTVTCRHCGLLPLDAEDEATDCEPGV